MSKLVQQIDRRQARVAVIGIGYVGLPLAVEIARAGYHTVGIDVDENKVQAVRQGKSYIGDVPAEDVAELVRVGRLKATTDYRQCKECEIINICVPTPFTATKDPDVSYIVEAGKRVAENLKPGRLIILRSTTYPETTEKVLLPILEQTGLKVGRDFFL
ncbi:MAG: NAD(P)-binding domain-containing protein, partial [candidate division WOR-3 bacterium]